MSVGLYRFCKPSHTTSSMKWLVFFQTSLYVQRMLSFFFLEQTFCMFPPFWSRVFQCLIHFSSFFCANPHPIDVFKSLSLLLFKIFWLVYIDRRAPHETSIFCRGSNCCFVPTPELGLYSPYPSSWAYPAPKFFSQPLSYFINMRAERTIFVKRHP